MCVVIPAPRKLRQKRMAVNSRPAQALWRVPVCPGLLQTQTTGRSRVHRSISLLVLSSRPGSCLSSPSVCHIRVRTLHHCPRHKQNSMTTSLTLCSKLIPTHQEGLTAIQGCLVWGGARPKGKRQNQGAFCELMMPIM